MDARETAMLVLNACERQGGWSDRVLKRQAAEAGLDRRDAGLAAQLCFGVLQNRMLLDFYLSKFSNIPLQRLEGKYCRFCGLDCTKCCFSRVCPTVRRWIAPWR